MKKYLIATASVVALLATPAFADTPLEPVDQNFESHGDLNIEAPILEHDLDATIVPTTDLEAPGEGLTNQTSTFRKVVGKSMLLQTKHMVMKAFPASNRSAIATVQPSFKLNAAIAVALASTRLRTNRPSFKVPVATLRMRT